MTVTLSGLTWDHPRGYAPLMGGAPEYEGQHPEVKIRWDRRSLREFGEAPIEQYVDRYDLIIVDHPFVGFAAAHDILLDLAAFLSEAEKRRFAQDSVGPSWGSYWYADALWAFPLDAATPVASYRADLLSKVSSEPPSTLASVIRLGHAARKSGQFIIVPACPTDAISLFFTLTASLGHAIAEDADPFVESSVGREVMGLLRQLIAVAHPRSLAWNPIQVYDFMVSSAEAIYCPYGFGYSNYSRSGRPRGLKFTNAPAAGSGGCAGTMLGGTGVAVSRASPHLDQAVNYARWLVSPEHQRGTYFREGGQPASLAAWTDAQVNAVSNDFFRATLRTLEGAYVRPRFDGFVPFFEAAGIEINRCLRGEGTDDRLIRWLNEHYATSRSACEGTRPGSMA
ncbi:MAG TPA: extracellular solute-binding protein [Terriglobales bacterium]|nr:extracellular solute-binding protein [Terriglobales bacterium]